MNDYLNDYTHLSESDYFKHLSFYESPDFLRETIFRKIPDVVPYVHNILLCLRSAEESRRIYEDILTRLTVTGKKNKAVHFSVEYPLGSISVDGRAYAQRQIREWCEYISKINDSMARILNILFAFPSSLKPLTSGYIANKIRGLSDAKLSKLTESFYQVTDVARKINNFSKHNLNVCGINKPKGQSDYSVNFCICYDDQELAVSEFMNSDNEFSIACRVIELLDYSFLCEKLNPHMNRYYVKSSAPFYPKFLVGCFDHCSFPDSFLQPVTFSVIHHSDGMCTIKDAKIHVDDIPSRDDKIQLAVVCEHSAPACVFSSVGLFEVNSIDVFLGDTCIGKYVCDDLNDQNAHFFHFKEYSFIPKK